MELNVFLADQNEYRIKKLKTLIRRLAYAENVEYADFLVCRIPEAPKKLEKRYWLQNQMAFISLDFPNALETGKILYAANPGCRLIYYKSGMTELLPLLPSRPVWYWNCDDFDALREIFRTQLQAMKNDSMFFYYQDRMRGLAIPLEAIYCCYSQRRNIYLHTPNGEIGPLPRTLDWLAERLPPESYSRVHQSFLVRRASVRRLDRHQKVIILEDGYEVPVSRAFYGQALEIFDQNDGLSDQSDDMGGNESAEYV